MSMFRASPECRYETIPPKLCQQKPAAGDLCDDHAGIRCRAVVSSDGRHWRQCSRGCYSYGIRLIPFCRTHANKFRVKA